MARYGQKFKAQAVARLLPPVSSPVEEVSREIGVAVDTLERWRSEALAQPSEQRTWTAAARLESVIATSSLDETAKSAWCRQHGVYPTELEKWRARAVAALATSHEARSVPPQARQDQRRIKQLERDLRVKEKALAETAALLVLSKKLSAIFGEGADE